MRDLLVILVVVLLVFGSSKLRAVGSDLGAAVKALRKSLAAGSSGKRSEQVESARPDAEFPEVSDLERNGRNGS